MNRFSTAALLIAGVFLLMGPEALAQNTPVGLWRTIDDRTGEVRSHVEIIQQRDGTYVGFIRHIANPERRGASCDECPAEWGQNQPVLGLQIIRNVRQRGGEFRDGQILDPEEGKIYGVRLRPVDGGRRLEVRGFIRVPLMGTALGRTQTWERIE
jgi:uncharacterized protein (DUF2147 family)